MQPARLVELAGSPPPILNPLLDEETGRAKIISTGQSSCQAAVVTSHGRTHTVTVRDEATRILARRKAAIMRIRCAFWLNIVLAKFVVGTAILQAVWPLVEGLLCQSQVTILWLRRFNPKRRNERLLLRLITKACTGMGSIVTLQDSEVHQYIGPFINYAWAVAAAVLIVGACIYPPFIPVALALLVVLLFVRRRIGYAHIKVVADVEKTNVPGMNHHRVWWPTNRIFVLKSADQVWQELIERMMRNVDVVVCDVTSFSLNLEWELHAALQKFPPEAVLLACALERRDAPRALPSTIRTALARAIGADTLKRMRIFFYPERRPTGFIWPSLFESELTEYLATLMAVSIAGSPVRIQAMEPQDLREMRELDLFGCPLCPYCANELPATSKFCFKCDLKVSPAHKESPF